MIADADYAIACKREPYFKYIYQLEDAESIDGDTSALIDKVPPEYKEEKDKYGVYRDMYGRPRRLTGKVIPVSTFHIRDILQRASLCEHSDPDPYSRAELDEKQNEIHTIQYDSMNNFKCKLDSVYHPLNDKITWLKTTMEYLADNINTILEQRTREA
ncbi:Uncharacterized protein Rs2_41045 [Raphanus sativus]|nr:Uncharacterized protein Rs2_41045 [Raphanus sativus]